ncbi:MAG TPA: aminodeoxychorismate lyase [Gammaproteobacteria bacterium]|nr:aminodeoxychorismate lyase [Gammaproteobacteria bacterium]
MSTGCWVNGEPREDIPAGDRGLHYGDGVFETLAVLDGRVRLLEHHLDRLAEGCSRLGFVAPDLDLLRDELRAAAHGQARAVLKLLVTRGTGGRGYRPPVGTGATRILLRRPWTERPQAWWQEGVRVRVCTTRLGRNPRLAGLKHLNRLEQVLARAEWDEEAQEGLMQDEGGFVIEGTMSNVFLVHEDGRVLTPRLDRCGVAGVMRRHLLEKAERAGLTVSVAELPLTDFASAREIFLCNSLIGVWPVARLSERLYPAGRVTRRFQQWSAET